MTTVHEQISDMTPLKLGFRQSMVRCDVSQKYSGMEKMMKATVSTRRIPKRVMSCELISYLLS